MFFSHFLFFTAAVCAVLHQAYPVAAAAGDETPSSVQDSEADAAKLTANEKANTPDKDSSAVVAAQPAPPMVEDTTTTTPPTTPTTTTASTTTSKPPTPKPKPTTKTSSTTRRPTEKAASAPVEKQTSAPGGNDKKSPPVQDSSAKNRGPRASNNATVPPTILPIGGILKNENGSLVTVTPPASTSSKIVGAASGSSSNPSGVSSGSDDATNSVNQETVDAGRQKSETIRSTDVSTSASSDIPTVVVNSGKLEALAAGGAAIVKVMEDSRIGTTTPKGGLGGNSAEVSRCNLIFTTLAITLAVWINGM